MSPCTWPLLMPILSCVFVLVLMVRIADAKLFKLDNPIAHQGCGPGMYSQSGGGLSNHDGVPILDIGEGTSSS